MIEKLHNLKKSQTEQKLIEKSALEQEVHKIEEDMQATEHRINTASVEKLGSISDFMVLAMHKDSLRFHIKNLLIKKNGFMKKIEELLLEIIELQKQSEQFKYILDEEKKEKERLFLHNEVLESEEFIQSKYIRG